MGKSRSLSKLACGYLLVVFALSGVAMAMALSNMSSQAQDWITFGALVLSAVLAQFYEIKSDERHSYYPHTVFFFAGVILLPPFLFVWLVIIPHLIEWGYKRLRHSRFLQDWYIQPFNVSTHVVAGFVAHAIYHSTLIGDKGVPANFGMAADVVSAYLAIFAYVLINHALIGQALVLARGISWQESELMDGRSLLPDGVMATLGYLLAVLWSVNPWLLAPLVSSLVLLSQALMVPQLKKEAEIDAKTGLFNARYFQSKFAAELQRAQRFGHPLSLILADLDLLRDINNVHGHLAGDAVIQGIADLIQQQTREYDIAGRFGGEEFAIVLPETESQEAQAIAERLRRVVEATIFREETSAVPIRATTSLGIATYPADAESVEQLIHQADIALYQAKYQGRNCTIVAADVPHSQKIQPANWSRGLLGTKISTDAEKVSSPAAASSAPSPSAEIEREFYTTAADAPAAPAPAAAVRKAMPGPLWVLLSSVILAAITVTGFGIFLHPQFDWLGVGIFLLLAALAEANQLDLFENNTISVSVAAAFATAVVGGIPGAVAAGATITLIHYVKMRPVWYKALFNWSVHLLAALPAACFMLLTHRLAISFEVASLPALTLLAIPVIGLVYLIESGLMATAIGLAMHRNPIPLWQERFQWLGLNYLVLGVLGLFLAVGYVEIGLGSIALFILPVLVMYATQKMYIRRTRASVNELRRMNQELSQANTEITRASAALRQANDEIQRLNDQLFLILAKVIDARDPEVADHATRVAAYATAVAARLNLSPVQQEHIRRAALLHDIGKLGIPEKILFKSTKLSDEEYRMVKRHAELGADLLETSDVLRQLAPAVRHHHERWDGSGYPDGLAREAIPLESRILGLCDAVEVMASGRPYAPAKSIDHIVNEVRQNKGTQFDPTVVAAFVELAQEEKNVWPDVISPSAPFKSWREISESSLAAIFVHTNGHTASKLSY